MFNANHIWHTLSDPVCMATGGIVRTSSVFDNQHSRVCCVSSAAGRTYKAEKPCALIHLSRKGQKGSLGAEVIVFKCCWQPTSRSV